MPTLTQPFLDFGQKEYGRFSRKVIPAHINLVGTTHIGPCVALFIFNKKTKKIFGFHIDAALSQQVISMLVGNFLTYDPDKSNYKAYVVGGWAVFREHGIPEKVLNILRSFDLQNIETHIYQKEYNGGVPLDHHYIQFAGINIETGELVISDDHFDPKLRFDERSEQERALVLYCVQNLLLSNDTTLTDDVRSYQQVCGPLPDASHEFFASIEKGHNATPPLPRLGFMQTFSTQQQLLITVAKTRNVLALIRTLLSSFITPVQVLLDNPDQDTVAHIILRDLKNHLDEYEANAIILLILLYARCNPRNIHGKTPLDELPEGKIKQGFARLLACLENPDIKKHRSITQRTRMILLSIVKDVHTYEKSDKQFEAAEMRSLSLLMYLHAMFMNFEQAPSPLLIFSRGLAREAAKINLCDATTIAVATAVAAVGTMYLALG